MKKIVFIILICIIGCNNEGDKIKLTNNLSGDTLKHGQKFELEIYLGSKLFKGNHIPEVFLMDHRIPVINDTAKTKFTPANDSSELIIEKSFPLKIIYKTKQDYDTINRDISYYVKSTDQAVIFNHKILEKAKNKAEKKLHNDNIKIKYKPELGDSIGIRRVNILSVDLNNGKYFLIRRKGVGKIFLNLYRVVEDSLHLKIDYKQSALVDPRDTLIDVNGDGLNDFIVKWYPSSGCCLANINDVFLNKRSSKGFSDKIELLNPNFYPNDRIIRGVDYGHPGKVSLYKYKWNNYAIDTIEFITPYFKDKRKFIKSKKPVYKPTPDDGTLLDTVPDEYKNIEGFDWFTAYKEYKEER